MRGDGNAMRLRSNNSKSSRSFLPIPKPRPIRPKNEQGMDQQQAYPGYIGIDGKLLAGKVGDLDSFMVLF